jgi:hypothetical protein
MIEKPLKPRERVLAIWAENRLGEREAIDWAVLALKSIRGELGSDMIALFSALERQAQSADVNDSVKVVWRLFKTAATDSSFSDSFMSLHRLKEKLEVGSVDLADVNEIVECYRPRLNVEPRSELSDEDALSPLEWVRWDFRTALRISDWRASYLSRKHLSSLSNEMLSELAERGTQALRSSLRLAEEIGWLGDGRDLPNYLLHRVFVTESKDDDEDDDSDPDTYNDNFAPLVRLLSSALEILSTRDGRASRHLMSLWQAQKGGIFLRLFAFGAWYPTNLDGDAVGRFLSEIKDHQFWRWTTFPEIASLRALRWNDLPREMQIRLGARLSAGPDNTAFLSDDVDDETKKYHRDHEVARLADAGANLPAALVAIVVERRATDPEFPRNVATKELGVRAARVSWVPPGKPEKFDGVPVAELLDKLIAAENHTEFGEGHHAEAFASGLNGKFQILEAMKLINASDARFVPVFKLLLSYPSAVSEDIVGERNIAQRIIEIAMEVRDDVFEQLVERLSYWVDWSDEKLQPLDGAKELWRRLLPLASRAANSKQDDSDVDLTSAALNEPFGHLLSFVIRRCLTLSKGPSALPRDLFTDLRMIHGRAREMWANRMAVSINYFAAADEDWLDQIVIGPMIEANKDGLRLWEAFAKFSPAPSAKVWARLEFPIYKRLQASDLSPDAMRRLAEMCVMAWVWSRFPDGYRVSAASMRSAMSLAKDDVRAAAAHQFSILFHPGPDDASGDDTDSETRWKSIGRRFFEEVWPLEPALQSAGSANDFARIPGALPGVFGDAVHTIAPFIVPFQVWSIETEFRLKPGTPSTSTIIKLYQEELLSLLVSCISPGQGNIYDLAPLIDGLLIENPHLLNDYRVRRLRKLST